MGNLECTPHLDTRPVEEEKLVAYAKADSAASVVCGSHDMLGSVDAALPSQLCDFTTSLTIKLKRLKPPNSPHFLFIHRKMSFYGLKKFPAPVGMSIDPSDSC